MNSRRSVFSPSNSDPSRSVGTLIWEKEEEEEGEEDDDDEEGEKEEDKEEEEDEEDGKAKVRATDRLSRQSLVRTAVFL